MLLEPLDNVACLSATPRIILVLSVVNFIQNAIQIDRPMLAFEMAGEVDFRRQMAVFVQVPDFFAIAGGQEFQCKLTKIDRQIADDALDAC